MSRIIRTSYTGKKGDSSLILQDVDEGTGLYYREVTYNEPTSRFQLFK